MSKRGGFVTAFLPFESSATSVTNVCNLVTTGAGLCQLIKYKQKSLLVWIVFKAGAGSLSP